MADVDHPFLLPKNIKSPSNSMMELNAESPEKDDENVFGITEDLVQSPQHKKADTTLINFDGLLTIPLKLQEDLAEGCGGQLWPAGMVLARYMLRYHRDKLQGQTILELGAGGGLVGLAVALGCNIDQPLYITDQRNMLALMQQNVALNGLQERVIPKILGWGTPPLTPTLPIRPTILLAADCVYFQPAFPLLQQTLLSLIGPNTRCYFCYKKRRKADLKFMKTARKMFDVRVVDDDEKGKGGLLAGEGYGRAGIFLYEFRAKGENA
ncbi:MAG: hypothetical protein M1827_005341 [Pycnora praestabilis]|nr:MAG: hypothetical protein M1827_005341 [Pycnora praestabilis]